MAKKIIFSAFLILVLLTSSFYFLLPGKVRIDIKETKTEYSVWDDKWVLAATEYVHLYDGTKKMRASSRELIYWNDSSFVYAQRKATWKDNITTKQTYIFSKYTSDVEVFPAINRFECFNCEGKIVHYEIRDILYNGETKIIHSPFSFGNNMRIEWFDDPYLHKIYQQKVSDKIIIRYRPITDWETYYVRLIDPASVTDTPNPITESDGSDTNDRGIKIVPNLNVSLNNFTKHSSSGATRAILKYNNETEISIVAFVGDVASFNNTVLTKDVNYILACDANGGSRALWRTNIGNAIPPRVNGVNVDFFSGYSAGLGGNGNFTRTYCLTDVTTTEVAEPLIILNVPVDVANLTQFNVTFNASVSSPVTISNTTLYGNWSGGWHANETNTSGIEGDYIFQKNITDGTYVWNVGVCTDEGTCVFSISNRTFTIDTTDPDITFSNPSTNSTNISQNYIEANVTSTDATSGLSKIIVRLYNSSQDEINSSLTSTSPNYINFSGLSDGTYYLNATANDTFGNENSTETRIIVLDTNNPLIVFVSETEDSNTLLDRDWIFVNVTVTETSPNNITFVLANSSKVINTTIRSMVNQTSNTSLNFTGLPKDVYTYNVTIFDNAGNSNSTETRIIILTNFSLTLEVLQANITAELGTRINITGDSFANTTICLDIIHPGFGINYSCTTSPNLINITPTFFSRNTFTNGSILSYNENGNNILYNVSINSHQYDEPDSIMINFSGSNGPSDLLIFYANTTPDTSNQSDMEKHLDRFFFGTFRNFKLEITKFLNGSLIEESTTNITYSTGGTAFIDFLFDDSLNGTTDYTFSVNVSGFEFGVDFTDGNTSGSLGTLGFDNYSLIDTSQTTAELDLSGGIMAKNVSIREYFFDDFEDTTVNQTLWTNTTCQDISQYFKCVRERGGILELINQKKDVGANPVSTASSVGPFALSGFTSDSINFSIATYYKGQESSGFNAFTNTYVSFGGTTIYSLLVLGSPTVPSTEISSSTLNFSLTKVNKTTWQYQIWGDEDASATTNVSSPVHIDYTGVKNNFTVTDSILKFNSNTGGNNDDIESYMNVSYVNQTLWTRENSSVVSNSIYDSSGLITKATLWYWLLTPNPSDENTTAYMSADNGDNWESVSSGSQHTFTNTGKNLRWRIDWNISATDNVRTSETIVRVNISIPSGFPTNISFDFGDDGITDATISGEFNSTNSPQIINLSGIDISSSFNESNRFTNWETYDHTFKIPLSITSDSIGTIRINELNLTYNPNPISLNMSNISTILSLGANSTNFRIPINFENTTSTTATLNVSNLDYHYAGGNYSVIVRLHNPTYSLNLTRVITYFYSRWDFDMPVDWLVFTPGSPTDLNVTPFGQDQNHSIFNITNLGYGGQNINLSVYQNETLGCVNLTMSLTNNRLNGSFVNESWLVLNTSVSYLHQNKVWLWADYGCNYTSWTTFDPFIFFRQCAEGVDYCSEAII